MTHLVTGYKGEEHIKSEDQGSFNASFFGTGQFVMEAGSQLEASITSNNNVRVFDGDILMKGRHIRINPNTYEDMTITTGTAGVNRNDLIVMTYQKNGTDGTEDAFLEVIKGTETASTASDPAYTDGDILGGATLNQMPLYRVKLEGVVLTAIEPLFDIIPTYATLAEQYKQEFIDSCESHLDSLNIYDTMEEVEANTQENQLAGALAVKELKTDIASVEADLTDTIPYNLIPFPYYNSNHTQNGIKWTVNEDGSVTANGTNTGISVEQFYFATDIEMGLKPNTTYTLTGCPSGGAYEKYRARIIINFKKGGEISYYDYGEGVTFTTPSNYLFCRIMIDIYTNITVENLTFKPMLVKGDTTKEFRRNFKSVYELQRYVTGTLAAGETTITLTDDAITTDSTFGNPFTTIWGVSPSEAPVVTNGSITYTFDAQDVDMGVKVRVM